MFHNSEGHTKSLFTYEGKLKKENRKSELSTFPQAIFTKSEDAEKELRLPEEVEHITRMRG